MEWRKHRNQMTPMEKQEIYKALALCSCYRFTRHSFDKKEQRGISNREIFRCIKYGDIIEFHYIKGQQRVLLRSNETVHNSNVCVVVDINTYEIVTAYRNTITDSHITLHTELYDSSYDLLSYIN